LVFLTLGAFGCSSSSPPARKIFPRGDAMAGEMLFHDRAPAGLGSNGRACSDCHVDTSSFQIGPVDIEARFQQMTASGVDDPLFRPVDADDFVEQGASASDYSHLREDGLFRIRFNLPANIKLVDPASCMTAGVAAPCQTATSYAVSTATFTDVWRGVPSVFNVSVSGPDPAGGAWPRGPNPQGGYQLDGRAGTLEDQALGAFMGHAEATTAPSDQMLANVAAYEGTLLANPEPALDALQTQGKMIFNRACGQCHNGPGMSTPASGPLQVVRYHDDEESCPRPVDTITPARWSFTPCPPALARNERTYEIAFSDGYKLRRTSSDPGRALLSGYVVSGPPLADGSCAHSPCGQDFEDDWQKLEIAPLHGISKTAPYFHDNSAATLEDVVIHYEELFKHVSAISQPPSGVPPLLTTDGVNMDRPNVPSERAALVAYLNVL
jgi:cytochrome c peroxidase